MWVIAVRSNPKIISVTIMNRMYNGMDFLFCLVAKRVMMMLTNDIEFHEYKGGKYDICCYFIHSCIKFEGDLNM
jgi:hypothetical protein